MLKTLDEIKEVEIEAGVVVNGIDNPNVLSIDSTEPVETKSDEVTKSAEEKNEVPDKPEKEEKVEEKESAPKDKVEEKKEKSKVEKKPETESKSVKKRIGDLTKKWRTTERERDYEREKRLEAEAKLKELESSVTDEEGRPQKEDYEDEDDYIEALIDWKSEVNRKASQKEVLEKTKDKTEREAIAGTYDGLDNAIDTGKEKYDDFEDIVMDEDLVISPELTQILLDSENPEDLMYHLGKNPDESARISELDPIRIAREVGKIEILLAKAEGRLEGTEDHDNPKPSSTNSLKKQSSAPEPIQPVKTTGVTTKDPNKMSPKEYREWRESGGK